MIMRQGEWPDLLHFLFQISQSPQEDHKEALPVFLKSLPLKEDHEVSMIVYSCICNLMLSSNPQTLMEDEPGKYQSHFSEYIKRGIEADNMEELYKKVHNMEELFKTLMELKLIIWKSYSRHRADPTPSKSPKEHKRYDHIHVNVLHVQLEEADLRGEEG